MFPFCLGLFHDKIIELKMLYKMTFFGGLVAGCDRLSLIGP